ncbi:tol-pal system YbgF family protein [Verrucomicrobiota bacterium]
MTEEHKTHEEMVAQHELETHEVKEVLNFFKKHGNMIGYTATALIAVFAITTFLNTKRAQKNAEAGHLLMTANSSEELQVIVDKHANTSAAPGALLALARSAYNKGDYETAQATYNKFLKKHGKHDMAAIAAYGQAACLEALGDLEAAAAEYQKVADEYKDSFIAPMALSNKSKLLAKQGNAK